MLFIFCGFYGNFIEKEFNENLSKNVKNQFFRLKVGFEDHFLYNLFIRYGRQSY